MNIFFTRLNGIKISYKKIYFVVKKKDLIYVKYYDQYKYIHYFVGNCLSINKTKNNDIFYLLYSKQKMIFFGFFSNSPLLLNLLKKGK